MFQQSIASIRLLELGTAQLQLVMDYSSDTRGVSTNIGTKNEGGLVIRQFRICLIQFETSNSFFGRWEEGEVPF